MFVIILACVVGYTLGRGLKVGSGEMHFDAHPVKTKGYKFIFVASHFWGH